MSTDKSKYNVEYFSGVVKPEASNSYGLYEYAEEVEERVNNESKYCKESKVTLLLDKDSIKVVNSFTGSFSYTEIGFLLEITNADGKYTSSGILTCSYEDEEGDSIMGAVLNSDGSALDCSVTKEGYVVGVNYTFINSLADTYSVKNYSIADLEPIVDYEESTVDCEDYVQGEDAEEICPSMQHVVNFIIHKVDCKEFIDFVESLKLLNRA